MRICCLVIPVLIALTGCEGASVLNKQELLERQTWWDNRDWDWYRERIPFFESPDPDIDATYYYRWEVLTKHLTYGSPEHGYTFTEFIDRPFWSGTYGAISCPAGHQHYEVRWLKDRQVIDDFARYWFETPGAQPRSYSNWYGDAMWATYMVLHDSTFLEMVLPHMESQFSGWMAERWDEEHGMFRWDGMHDGMETNINSRQTADSFMGAEGYRPTLNSYMYADALAISRSARLLGDTAKADSFAQRALDLRERVQTELWDPERRFFFHQFAYDEPNGIQAKSLTYETGLFAGSPHGRELIGYVPWQFNLPQPGYEEAWRFLMDEEYFAAPFGPTTVEQQDPLFLTTDICCVWSGNAWPYATSQTLVAMANLLNDYSQEYVDRTDYFTLFKTYTMDQRKNGRPYIAEAADPFSGSWEGHDTYYHSEHYLHSGYVDLLITGLVGLRPRADDTLEVNPLVPADWDYFALDDVSYKGRRVSVVWDRDGSKYGTDPGLTVLIDGRVAAHSDTVARIKVVIRPSTPSRVDRMFNYAVNNGRQFFPAASASYSSPRYAPHYAVDGNYWYHNSPPNRWTAEGSANDVDWLMVDFGVERPIEVVKVYFLEDSANVKPPDAYDVQYWTGTGWTDVTDTQRSPAEPEGRRANTVSFAPILTSRMRILLTHQPGSHAGVSEFETWGRGTLPLEAPRDTVANLAFNAGDEYYPLATASYEAASGPATHANDEVIAFTRYSRNRWSTVGTPNAEDWIQLEFETAVGVGTVDVYYYGDEERGVTAPADYSLQYRVNDRFIDAGVLSRFPSDPMAWALNRIVIEPVHTDAIRLLVTHRPGASSAITEVRVWGRQY